MSKGLPWYLVGAMMFGLFVFDVGGLISGKMPVSNATGFGVAVICALVGLVAMIQGDIRADKHWLRLVKQRQDFARGKPFFLGTDVLHWHCER
jgi:hypothetical protein